MIQRTGLDPELFYVLSQLWSNHHSLPKTVYLSLFSHRDEESKEPFKSFTRRQWHEYLISKLSEFVS